LLRLGYDGAVDPTTYLHSWRQLRKPTPATAAVEVRETVGCASARRLLGGHRSG
jgi:hypothetical protein